MSDAPALDQVDFVLRDRGTTGTLDAFVVSARFDRRGTACAFATGDGTVHLAPVHPAPVHLAPGSGAPASVGWTAVPVHDGAVLSLAEWNGGWATGGDDGALRAVAADGTVAELARFGSRWVEQLASFGEGKGGESKGGEGKGALLAAAVGKSVHLFDASGAKLRQFDHPSTVTGVAFDGKGKRLGASHYGGCSLWFVGAKEPTPRLLEWKGSHIGVALHPAADSAVTAMQENALHGWRLADGQHMRMSGYPAKTESMSFSRTGKWLATAGAESVVLWPFFGGGPMGKAPTELAGGDGPLCTRVAFHPRDDMVAAGFADGLVVLADVGTERVLPVAAPGRGPVSALCWSPDGSHLAFGTETGFAATIDLSRKD